MWPSTCSACRGPSDRMRALDGITVVTLEHAIAAPFCTRQLADLGARVIKIERPGGRRLRPRLRRARARARVAFRLDQPLEGKPDPRRQAPRGGADPERLVARADVLVQNLAPGAAARLGLSYETLAREHPRLIVCDISGYGADGPYRDKKAYDLLIQSESGFLSITGSPDEPAKAGCSIADIAAGMYAYSEHPRGAARAREGPAAAGRSTYRCWRAWSNGWAIRSTTRTTARSRRRARAPRTRRSIRTARSPPATARP